MTTTAAETADPRYPVGRYRPEREIDADQRAEWIQQIADTPARFRQAVQGLGDDQLDTPYRDGGWTVRDLVHHLPDSHMNAYIRVKLGLTEENPPIKTYDEAAWAALPETGVTPAEVSLALLDGIHVRWVNTLRGMGEGDWARTIQHPEWGAMRLDQLLGLYAWHGRHHVAHVTRLRERNGW
ncbi:MAG: bacillithiol transferase BstA [Gemmatimonadetes bacterium]|nr:bacillithiol transferase BstA [Gemmatimonadota bacterium]